VKSGFTIIEILVVLSITVLLTSLIITYSAAGRAQVALYIEESKMGQIILKAKSLAIATYNDPSVPCGYGVNFNYANAQYVLFGYRAPDCKNISAIDPSDPGFSVIDQFDLSSLLNFGNGPGRIDSVFFLPPNPKTLIWTDGGNSSGSGEVYLETKNKSAALGIQVTQGGQVSF